MNVPPHNFTHSPVDEVCCRISFNDHAPIEIIIPSPYPGWQDIREKIANVIESFPGNITIHSCMLRYTDIFPLQEGDIPHMLISVAPKFSESELFKTSGRSISEITVIGSDNSTEIIIRFRQEIEKIILVFETVSDKEWEIRFDSVLKWFDYAREDIHMLFDRVVSDELKGRVL